MPIVPLNEEQLKEEYKREEAERRWYSEENQKNREYNLKIAQVKAQTEREKIKNQKRYIHAIVLLKLFNKKIPKVFIKHLS